MGRFDDTPGTVVISTDPSEPVRLGPVLLAVLLLAAAPTVQAALNHPLPYRSQEGYMQGLTGPRIDMVSGELDMLTPTSGGTFGFFSTQGTSITGLTRVCYSQVLRQCIDSVTGGLRIDVATGGSFGLKLPQGVEATLEAQHALAMFADLSGQTNLNSLDIGPSLLAPLVVGKATLQGIPSIPNSAASDLQGTGAGAIVGADGVTTITITNDGLPVNTQQGKGVPVTFAGKPVVTPIGCELAIMPFKGPSAQAHFKPATRSAARLGLDIDRVNQLIARLFQSSSEPAESSEVGSDAFGPYRDAAAVIFAGALLRMPTENASAQDIAFARLSSLEVDGTTANGLAWSGKATFEIRAWHVTGAKSMLGFGPFQLPWWSWALWVLGIAAFVVRLVRKPDKHHPTWDRFKWVGWVASPLFFLLTFFLWDLELRATLGISLLSGDAHGQVLLFVALMQTTTWLMASFAAIAPLRLLSKNLLLIFRQGTFMGLSGAAASLLGFLLIATYLRAFLDVILQQVSSAIG